MRAFEIITEKEREREVEGEKTSERLMNTRVFGLAVNEGAREKPQIIVAKKCMCSK